MDSGLPKLQGKILVLDTETTGLKWHDRIFCWGYMTEEGEYGFMEKTPETLAWLAGLFEDPTLHIVLQNAQYDLMKFMKEGIDVLSSKAQIHCTLILAKVFHGQLWSYDLRALAARYLGRSSEGKDEIQHWLKQNKLFQFNHAPREMVKRRVLWDVETTLMLFLFLHPRVMQDSPDLYETERKLVLVVVDMQFTGVRVDITRAKELKAAAEQGCIKLQADLDRLICPLKLKIACCTNKKCKRKKKICNVLYKEDIPEFCPLCKSGITIREEVLDSINTNSSAIEVPAAFVQMGIQLVHKTKPKKGKKGKKSSTGGRWSFDEYSLIKYVSPQLGQVIKASGEEGWPLDKFYDQVYKVRDEHNLPDRELICPLMLKLNELKKMISTYYDHIIFESIDQHVGKDGREYGTIHARFNQSQADTGRFSSSDPNLQNMPRLLGPRECFVPRARRRNWHFDYEQVEMRFFAHFAEDRGMADAIDRDIHKYIAAQIYNLPEEGVSSEQRKRGKQVGFGVLYGAGAPKIAETLTRMGLMTTPGESALLVANYHRRFPSVKRKTNEFKTALHRQGYVANPYGRRYHIPLDLGYKMLNYMCQGTSADLMKAAMVRVWRYIRDNGFKAKILIQVHDELIVEIPSNEEERLVPKIKQLMEDRTTFFVPITVGVDMVQERWSKKVKEEHLPKKIVALLHAA